MIPLVSLANIEHYIHMQGYVLTVLAYTVTIVPSCHFYINKLYQKKKNIAENIYFVKVHNDWQKRTPYFCIQRTSNHLKLIKIYI